MNLQNLIDQLDTRGDKAAEKVIRKLARHGKRAVPGLMKAAKDTSRPFVRKWSLQALGAIGDPRAASLLITALKDERMTVRLHAVRVGVVLALKSIGAKPVLPRLRKALEDPAWYVRQNAAVVIGELKDKASVAALKRLVENDPKKAVSNAAKAAVAKIKSPAYSPRR